MKMKPGSAPEQRPDIDSPPQQLCRACKSPMPAGANKCTECSSLQDWRRYLDSSGIVLSLLVALTSLLTFAIPVWKETLVAKVAKPNAALIEVDDSGLATIAVTNGGNAPAVLEDIIFGTDEAVVSFDLASVPPDERIVGPNSIRAFSLRLAIANSVDSVWSVVQIFRKPEGCAVHIAMLSPDGTRTSTEAHASTAGFDDAAQKSACALKLEKLTTMTLDYLSTKDGYGATFCKVAELHPRDPQNPQPGSACRKNGE